MEGRVFQSPWADLSSDRSCITTLPHFYTVPLTSNFTLSWDTPKRETSEDKGVYPTYRLWVWIHTDVNWVQVSPHPICMTGNCGRLSMELVHTAPGAAMECTAKWSCVSLTPFQVQILLSILTWFTPEMVYSDAPDPICDPQLQLVWTQPKAERAKWNCTRMTSHKISRFHVKVRGTQATQGHFYH